jgi:hypothetical protein
MNSSVGKPNSAINGPWGDTIILFFTVKGPILIGVNKYLNCWALMETSFIDILMRNRYIKAAGAGVVNIHLYLSLVKVNIGVLKKEELKLKFVATTLYFIFLSDRVSPGRTTINEEIDLSSILHNQEERS